MFLSSFDYPAAMLLAPPALVEVVSKPPSQPTKWEQLPLVFLQKAPSMTQENKATELVRNATVHIRQVSGKRMGIIRSKGFSCLGLLHPDGTWRDSRGSVLEVVEVISEF